MRRFLVVLFVGVSIAVPGAMAFAASAPGKDSVDHQRLPEPALPHAEATFTGTIAGPTTPLPVGVQVRYEYFGH